MGAYSSDVAFTETVKAIQARKGSRAGYQRMEEEGGFQTIITPDLAAFVAEQRSIFVATANASGQPYIQHRGGPPGFIKILDDKTLGFTDYRGNRQYISQGNLVDNPKAFLFLIDYMNRQRIKIWGTAKIVEGDEALAAKLMPEGYKAKPEQVFLFTIEAWNGNCPQHIPQRFEADDVTRALEQRERRIAALEAEVVRLKESASRNP